MSKFNRFTQTGLDSIFEESDLFKTKSHEPTSLDYDYKNFDKKETQVKRGDLNLKINPSLNESDLFYLKKNWSLINSSQKKNELEVELQAKREEANEQQKNVQFDVFNKRVYEARNPFVTGLLKDIRSNSGLSQLQEDLKKEFDMFLTTSVTLASESLRDTAGKSYQQQVNSNRKNFSSAFLTQQNDQDDFYDDNKSDYLNISINDHFSQAQKENNETKFVKSNTNINSMSQTKLLKKKSTQELKKNGKQQLAIIENNSNNNYNNNSNLQVALIADDNQKNQSIIKLNKILENIKRIDLPKFQPELHQICQ
jgi:hypothetical protein